MFCVLSLRYLWTWKSMFSIVESLVSRETEADWNEKKTKTNLTQTRIITAFCCVRSVDTKIAHKSPNNVSHYERYQNLSSNRMNKCVGLSFIPCTHGLCLLEKSIRCLCAEMIPGSERSLEFRQRWQQCCWHLRMFMGCLMTLSVWKATDSLWESDHAKWFREVLLGSGCGVI